MKRKPRKPRDLWGGWGAVGPDVAEHHAVLAREGCFNARDLRRLAKWAEQAAAYLEAREVKR